MARRRLSDNALEPRIFDELDAFSIEEYVEGLRTPTLIVWGEEDRALHVDTARVLHDEMPRSEVVVMPGVGHLPMVERPRESAERYLEFRDSL
jgi:pimeloyl-ACP methyl ester carboxylesterase